MNFTYKNNIFILLFFLIMFAPHYINIYEFPTYRLVIDPGHGGLSGKIPRFGDRYDSISKKYLDLYKSGAARGSLKEHEIVFDIAKKVLNVLKNCKPGGDFNKFKKILGKYTNRTPRRINIVYKMSRGEPISKSDRTKMNDPNENFRLFDSYDKFGLKYKGRISKINSFKPQLVVSLHLAGSGPREYKGMNPIVVAPYGLLKKGLQYLKGDINDRDVFHKSKYTDWFIESSKKNNFHWFLNDSSLYFTGYPITNKKKIDLNKFKGYRFNMVSWKYSDDKFWENILREVSPFNEYSKSYDNFIPEGRFWKREKSIYEKFRRDGGEEGFGGDNAYASYEIIRYILYSLKLKKNDHRRQKPGKSYVSVWILPLHVNAINAFIELGYLNRKRDRFLFRKKREEIAEGIAVGIYSLFAGLELQDDFRYLPRGKKINFEKYKISGSNTYFNEAVSY